MDGWRGSVTIATTAKKIETLGKKYCRWRGEFTRDVYTEISSSEVKEFGTAFRSTVVEAERAKGREVSFEFNI